VNNGYCLVGSASGRWGKGYLDGGGCGSGVFDNCGGNAGIE
jgi:hypothetical protein